MNQPSNHNYSMLALVTIILSTLACQLMPINQDSNVQQTLASISITQSALATQVANVTDDPKIEMPTAEPPLISTTTSEPDMSPSIAYEGVSFYFGPEIAISANAETIPEQDLGEEYMPGDSYPAHYEFTFNDYTVGDHFHRPRIMVFPTDAYRSISPLAGETLDNLQQFLNTQSRAGINAGLPFLPFWPAAQMFAANIEFFEFQSSTGVRYLTMYGQAAYPVDNTNLFYTFQGLTHDGQYFISAILPITHPGLPEDGDDIVEDWTTFFDTFETYLSETTAWLDNQPDDFFNPRLNDLDAMIVSIKIDK